MVVLRYEERAVVGASRGTEEMSGWQQNLRGGREDETGRW